MNDGVVTEQRSPVNAGRTHVVLRRWRPARIEIGGIEARDAAAPAVWQSPVLETDFDITSLIPSWSALTPGAGWIEVAVRGGRSRPDSDWFVLARWAETSDSIQRTTVDAQRTSGARVHNDEVGIDADAGWRTAEVRITSHRADPVVSWPDLQAVNLLASGAPSPSPPGAGSGHAHVIDVPPYSQQHHTGDLPELGGGGKNWCSPTSVAMLLSHWETGPSGLPPSGERNPLVPHAAQHTYDTAFGGTGNWAFNTAYAARFGLDAFVTRLRSLDEAEMFTRAGIPLVLSVVFTADQLDGAGFDTDGHLVVLVGFDAAGNPVVNDPASSRIVSNDEVRRTYRRDQFAEAWLTRSSAIAYVIRPFDRPLPPPPAEANWSELR